MERASRVPVAVLGAGLTGLAAAHALERMRVSYRLFEKSREVGGLATTHEEKGFRFDRTGHLLHVRDDALRAEILEWLDGACTRLTRRSRIWSHGVYTRYPFQANTHGLPPAVAYECVRDFVHAISLKPTAPVKNFEQFCLTHFGAGFSKHFMLPYNRRLWGVPLDEITAEWCERFVPIPRLEDVLAGAVGLNDRELGYNAEFLYPVTGIGELPRALARRVGGIELGRAPILVRAAAKELVFDDERVTYETLVSTVPLPALLDSFDTLPTDVREARRALRSTELHYLDVALSAPAGHDLHWVYVPEERYPFYRVGCYSNFSDAMAPTGGAGLYVELVDRRAPDLAVLVPRVVRDLREMGWIRSERDVAFVRARSIPVAYVVYDHRYRDALDTIQPFLESVGVISTGRYGAWNYSSMEDAILFGRSAAERAATKLR